MATEPPPARRPVNPLIGVAAAVVVALIVAWGLLTGDGKEESAAGATATPTATLPDLPPAPDVTARDLSTAEAAFLRAVRSEVSSVTAGRDDEDLLGIGEAMCDEPSLDALIEDPPDEFDRLAVRHLCPKHLPLLKRAADGITEGEWTVGDDVKPGTYRTTGGRVTGCYWERSTRGGDIIDNGAVTNAPGGVTVTIARTDGGFTTRGCGNWARVR